MPCLRARRALGPLYFIEEVGGDGKQSGDYTRRRRAGRQPPCGIGVTSMMASRLRPAPWSPRMDCSRPGPSPFTSTITDSMLKLAALRMAFSAATFAEYGVDLRVPSNPDEPELDHARTFP